MASNYYQVFCGMFFYLFLLHINIYNLLFEMCQVQWNYLGDKMLKTGFFLCRKYKFIWCSRLRVNSVVWWNLEELNTSAKEYQKSTLSFWVSGVCLLLFRTREDGLNYKTSSLVNSHIHTRVRTWESPTNGLNEIT